MPWCDIPLKYCGLHLHSYQGSTEEGCCWVSYTIRSPVPVKEPLRALVAPCMQYTTDQHWSKHGPKMQTRHRGGGCNNNSGPAKRTACPNGGTWWEAPHLLDQMHKLMGVVISNCLAWGVTAGKCQLVLFIDHTGNLGIWHRQVLSRWCFPRWVFGMVECYALDASPLDAAMAMLRCGDVECCTTGLFYTRC